MCLNLPLPVPHRCYFVLSWMTTKVSGSQTLLSRCITALTRAGLEFRANKSHSIVIVKGRSMNATPFFVSKTSVHPEVSSPISSIHSRPIKFLGRIIDVSISDRNSSAEQTDFLTNRILLACKNFGFYNIYSFLGSNGLS